MHFQPEIVHFIASVVCTNAPVRIQSPDICCTISPTKYRVQSKPKIRYDCWVLSSSPKLFALSDPLFVAPTLSCQVCFLVYCASKQALAFTQILLVLLLFYHLLNLVFVNMPLAYICTMYICVFLSWDLLLTSTTHQIHKINASSLAAFVEQLATKFQQFFGMPNRRLPRH